MSFRLTAALVGILTGALILWLIRRDRLQVKDALFWLALALGAVFFAAFPRAIDTLGAWAGVAYPPAFLFGLVILALLLKTLLADIQISLLRRDLRRLTQQFVDGTTTAGALPPGIAAADDASSRAHTSKDAGSLQRRSLPSEPARKSSPLLPHL